MTLTYLIMIKHILPANMSTSKLFQTIIVVVVIAFAMGLTSCVQQSTKKERKIERSFYYWKSVFSITDYERKAIADWNISTLYLKFFDVDWDKLTHQPLPIAQVRIKEPEILNKNFKCIIPTVFITNNCIRNIDSLQATELGVKISTLVNKICNANQIAFTEIQIDCDWTVLTKENYFILLESIKKHQSINKKISATIRLHQIKYSNKTGIPPVDRGLLMAYNMGNLKDPSSNNSILESKELKKYISNLLSYPLLLDVGLPLFEWKILFRNNIYAGLIENLPDHFLDNQVIKKISENRFKFLKDTVLNGYAFLKEDILRKEESSFDEIVAAERILTQNLSTKDIRLSLFHLDSLILKKYTAHEMEVIFNGLH